MKKIIDKIVEVIRYNLGVVPDTEDYIDDHIDAGHIDIIKSLIEANPTLIQCRDCFGNSLLHTAVQEKQTELVKYFIQVGCDVNAQDENGETPLHVAAIFPSKEIAELLVHNGADPSIVDNDGETALSIATE